MDCIRFPSCKHVYCKDCVTSYFTIQIRDGCVRSLHCPEDKCESQAEPNMVRITMGEEILGGGGSEINSFLDKWEENNLTNMVQITMGGEVFRKCFILIVMVFT